MRDLVSKSIVAVAAFQNTPIVSFVSAMIPARTRAAFSYPAGDYSIRSSASTTMLRYSKSDGSIMMDDDEPSSASSALPINSSSLAAALLHEDSRTDRSSSISASLFDNLGDIMATDETSYYESFTTTLDDDNERERQQQIHHHHHSGLVTSIALNGKMLNEKFVADPPFSALDRIILTANGNLQRIISSYYDAPVEVKVVSCIERPPIFCESDKPCLVPGIWDRKVELEVSDMKFCTATSEITVHEPHCAELVRNGKVGLGQLFRYLDKLPTFDLMNAGRTSEGGMWRLYELKSNELTCSIFEEFSPNVWSIQ